MGVNSVANNDVYQLINNKSGNICHRTLLRTGMVPHHLLCLAC